MEYPALFNPDQSGVVNIFAVLDPHLQNPYSMNFYLGIQRQVTPTVVLQLNARVSW
jgi:hypothetical protein